MKYSEDYWHTYGYGPPAYTGDYAGQETCVQYTSDGHPYDNTTIRRGINFKSGLPATGAYTYAGQQYW